MKHQKIKKYLILLASGLVFTFSTANAQKEKFQSIFIYNFSKYVKWPDSMNSGKFVIGVIGSSAMQNELKSMAASKNVNGLPIEVRQFNSAAEVKDCHILYLASSESGKIDQIVSLTNGKAILIVTDKPGLAEKGASINFVEVDGKIKFELSHQNTEQRGLKVAGSLASLAILV